METGKYFLVKCSKCGELTPASRFCKNCGSFDGRITAELEAINCPHCGRKVADGNYCGSCGEPIKK